VLTKWNDCTSVWRVDSDLLEAVSEARQQYTSSGAERARQRPALALPASALAHSPRLRVSFSLSFARPDCLLQAQRMNMSPGEIPGRWGHQVT
jgi:hypothetical protein